MSKDDILVLGRVIQTLFESKDYNAARVYMGMRMWYGGKLWRPHGGKELALRLGISDKLLYDKLKKLQAMGLIEHRKNDWWFTIGRRRLDIEAQGESRVVFPPDAIISRKEMRTWLGGALMCYARRFFNRKARNQKRDTSAPPVTCAAIVQSATKVAISKSEGEEYNVASLSWLQKVLPYRSFSELSRLREDASKRGYVTHERRRLTVYFDKHPGLLLAQAEENVQGHIPAAINVLPNGQYVAHYDLPSILTPLLRIVKKAKKDPQGERFGGARCANIVPIFNTAVL